MSVGSDITESIRSGQSAAGDEPDKSLGELLEGMEAEDVPDEEEFEDDGLLETSTPEPRGVVVRPNGQEYRPRTIAGVEDVAFIQDAKAHREHIVFYGPPGTGKTAVSEAACFLDAVEDEAASAEHEQTQYVHLGFEQIVCSVDTTEGGFFGGFTQDPESGTYEWHDGPLLRALRWGIPLYVDEIFLCDSRVLSSTLYPVMDGRTFLTVPMNPRLGRVPVSRGFFVIAAGNPNVPGADYSEALRSRFVHQIEVTSDWKLTRSLGVPQNIITVAKNLDRKRRDEGSLSWSPQTRDLLLYSHAKKRYGLEFALSGLLGKAPFEDRAVIQEALQAKFGAVQPLAVGESTAGGPR